MTTFQQTQAAQMMTATNAQPSPEAAGFASKLRKETIACRLRHDKMGTRKALTRQQVEVAAEQFDAEPRSLSARKKLINTRDEAYRQLVIVRSAATKYWKSITVPYPESGIRLLRRDRVDEFQESMERYRERLNEAVAELVERWEGMIEEARARLGTLFNVADYPSVADVAGEFGMEWDYPSIEPPAYLKRVHPALYEAESKRIAARFEEAVRLTESAFAERFQQLVAHLHERLTGEVDGKPKVFHDTAITNLQGFFQEFRALNVGSSSELEKLVDQAQQVVAGVGAAPGSLRESVELRTQVAAQLSEVEKALDSMMIAKPKRAIRLEGDDA